jgi:tetratricopeptide (TPR) repeat protein
MNKLLCRAVSIFALLIFAAHASAFDFVKDSVPCKWMAPLLPEDLPELKFPEYFSDLDKARAQMFAGRYKLSLITLAKAKEADPLEAALVKANSLAAIGREKEAIGALSQPAVKDKPRAQVLRATILASQGQTDEAIALLKEHLSANPASLIGHYQLGRVSEQVGDLDAARKAYGWFIEDQQLLEKWQGQTGEKTFDDADSVTTIGRSIDRWASLTGGYKGNASLHNAILNMFVKAYDQIDRAYWPAHVAAAEYFLSHDDKDQALKELEQALNQNPNDVEALRLMGLIALDSFNFDGTDKLIDAIRKINPESITAEILETRTLLQQRRAKDAFDPVQRVLKRQPKNLEAMGLLAAAHALRLEDEQASAAIKAVEKIDPDNATAYFEVAEQLGAMRQYPRAAEHYKIAIQRADWWTAPRNGLGLLYTQSGDEDEARVTLDAAHTLDPFNLASTNYLRLLDDMAKFARSETDHFIVMYDAKADPVIPEYFGEYLETIYKDVTADFQHAPKQKTIIEVFPMHDAFSVRTTGSPWIGTVGASTGRVIAMVAPRKGKLTMGTFNWAAVLRHEFTHTVTLSATDNRIAHWMTEGLAVLEEQSPLQWNWVPMLNDAVKKDKLFSLENLTWGFVRPRKPSDRQLAYAQSFWICQYIEEKYGRPAILKMLESFRNGRNEQETFSGVLRTSPEDFTKDFFAWTRKQVQGWGYDEETSKKVEEIKPQAEALLAGQQYADALPLWEELNTLRPMEPVPHMRLASIYLKLKRTDDAVKHLEAIDAVELKDNRYAKAIARIYRDAGKMDRAVKYAMQSVYIDPYDDAAHELLAGLYEKTGNETGLSREKRVMRVLTEWRQRKQQEDAATDSTAEPAAAQ